jgi:pimeloyl-ACP methyl ester carboxylesterase
MVELVVSGKRVRAATGGRPLDLGSRPLLVLVHGAGMDHTVWALIGRALAHRGYSLLAPDLPGHAGSEGPAPTTVEDYAAWTAQLLDTVDAGPAHVAGHSMGSLTVLHLAATDPDAVRTLTMLGTAALMPVHPELQAAADRHDHLAIELITGWSLPAATHLGRHPTPGMSLRDGTVRLMERIDPAVIASDLRASNAYDGAVTAAGAVRCPALLILGEQDMMTRPSGAAPLTAALAGAETVVLPDTGHLMMLERPHVVIDTMLEFLEHDRS